MRAFRSTVIMLVYLSTDVCSTRFLSGVPPCARRLRRRAPMGRGRSRGLLARVPRAQPFSVEDGVVRVAPEGARLEPGRPAEPSPFRPRLAQLAGRNLRSAYHQLEVEVEF